MDFRGLNLKNRKRSKIDFMRFEYLNKKIGTDSCLLDMRDERCSEPLRIYIRDLGGRKTQIDIDEFIKKFT